jgi:hypothetical protein
VDGERQRLHLARAVEVLLLAGREDGEDVRDGGDHATDAVTD